MASPAHEPRLSRLLVQTVYDCRTRRCSECGLAASLTLSFALAEEE